MKRWQVFPLILVLLLSLPSASFAKVFVLPGIFYTDEYGVVGSLAFIMEMKRSERLETRLEYFGADEGQVLFNIFIPRASVEWTFESRGVGVTSFRITVCTTVYKAHLRGLILRVTSRATLRCSVCPRLTPFSQRDLNIRVHSVSVSNAAIIAITAAMGIMLYGSLI
jgi:hypothetical protein